MLRRVLFFLICGIFITQPCVFADEAQLKERINRLESRIEALEKKLCEQQKCISRQDACIAEQRQKISEYQTRLDEVDEKLHRRVGPPAFTEEGFKIGAGATMVLQGTDRTNAGTEKKEDRADASYSIDITLEKEIEEAGGRAFVHFESGQGAGIEDELTLYSNVNRDADNDNNVRLTELWYEQGLFDNRLLLTFGKLEPPAYFDENEAANAEQTQFLGRIFRNNPTIEFPDNTPGIRIGLELLDWLELSAAVFDGDSNWEKVGDNTFNIGQFGFKTNFFGLPGNYRFLGWNSNVHHTKWLATERQKENAYGFGLSFDQKASDTITLFTRFGWQDPKVYNPNVTATGGSNYSLEYSLSAGAEIEGAFWGREKDIFGIAAGYVSPSDDYKKFALTKAKTEGHFESYYNIRLNDHLSVSPDFQVICNPFGDDVADGPDTICVYGVRTQVDF